VPTDSLAEVLVAQVRSGCRYGDWTID